MASRPDAGRAGADRPGSLFTPRDQAASRQRTAEPVYRLPAPTAPQGPSTPEGSTASRGLAPSRYFASADGRTPSATAADEPRADRAEQAGPPAATAETDELTTRAADRWAGAFEAPARRSAAGPATRQTGKQPSGKSGKSGKPVRKGGAAATRGRKPRRGRHHDWAWEAVGFLVCVAVAMAVFFAMPAFFGF
jgi:hypothetical protein